MAALAAREVIAVGPSARRPDGLVSSSAKLLTPAFGNSRSASQCRSEVDEGAHALGAVPEEEVLAFGFQAEVALLDAEVEVDQAPPAPAGPLQLQLSLNSCPRCASIASLCVPGLAYRYMKQLGLSLVPEQLCRAAGRPPGVAGAPRHAAARHVRGCPGSDTGSTSGAARVDACWSSGRAVSPQRPLVSFTVISALAPAADPRQGACVPWPALQPRMLLRGLVATQGGLCPGRGPHAKAFPNTRQEPCMVEGRGGAAALRRRGGHRQVRTSRAIHARAYPVAQAHARTRSRRAHPRLTPNAPPPVNRSPQALGREAMDAGHQPRAYPEPPGGRPRGPGAAGAAAQPRLGALRRPGTRGRVCWPGGGRHGGDGCAGGHISGVFGALTHARQQAQVFQSFLLPFGAGGHVRGVFGAGNRGVRGAGLGGGGRRGAHHVHRPGSQQAAGGCQVAPFNDHAVTRVLAACARRALSCVAR
jgi:hypothetical protein